MLSSRFSARSCALRSPTSASWRCFANSASSVKTIVPPTVMLSASIRLENHSGSGDWLPRRIAAMPEPRKRTSHRTNQRMPEPTPRNTSAPSGARIPHRPTPPVGRKPPIGIIDRVGAMRDGQELDVQQRVEVARSGEDGDRRQRDHGVEHRDPARPRPEREVQDGPDPRDRQDQDRDEDEERLLEPRLLVVARLRADHGEAGERGVEQPSECGHESRIGTSASVRSIRAPAWPAGSAPVGRSSSARHRSVRSRIARCRARAA